ncbi:MAG: NACHT domain-containing protein [Desulfomonile tiedjei]|nr:NACHT domain-containing protein [Desulfomonile tiedjei]
MNDPSSSGLATMSRTIRVYVAGDAADLQQERALLWSQIFPELRLRCRRRQLEFAEVDLGQGLEHAGVEPSEFLAVALAEIDRCRPYFVGILGERYGSAPDPIDPELVGLRPWLVGHLDKGPTELQILHGALNDPSSADHAFFYLRDPGYVDRIPDALRQDFEPEDSESRNKLEMLNNTLRESSLPVRENYSDPQALGQMILNDLWTAIDKAFPAAEQMTALDREAHDHATYAESRIPSHITRESHVGRLDDHAKSGTAPLIVVGGPGSGKSALLAHWSTAYRQTHPDELVVAHFCGSSPAAGDHVLLMRRILAEIKHRLRVEEAIPEAPEKLKIRLPVWLEFAASKCKLVLVLDGVDQLTDRNNAGDMRWLPETLPANLRLIVSTSPGRLLAALEQRGWLTVRLDEFSAEERDELITRRGAEARKPLTPQQRGRIAEASQTSNPAFLNLLLHELRDCLSTAQVDDLIARYLEAATLEDLYQRILDRLEADHDRVRPRMVEHALSLLVVARRGLYESELLESIDQMGPPLPRVIWSRFFLAMRGLLVSQGGLLRLPDATMRRVVEHRYLKTSAARHSRHLRLATSFLDREMDTRKAEELPWHLREARAWESLKDILVDPEMFGQLSTRYRFCELSDYWASLAARYDMGRTYEESMLRCAGLYRPEGSLAVLLARASNFVRLHGKTENAERIRQRALEVRELVHAQQRNTTAEPDEHTGEQLEDKET